VYHCPIYENTSGPEIDSCLPQFASLPFRAFVFAAIPI
jgi:hypothetical protein